MIDTKRLFNDVFSHLAVEVTYKQGLTSFSCRALIKSPEAAYEIGGSQVIGQIAEVAIKVADLLKTPPRVGDKIIYKNRLYKVFEEPLLDASNEIYKMQAAVE